MFDYLFAQAAEAPAANSASWHARTSASGARRLALSKKAAVMAKITMVEAINMALAWEMAHDPTVVVVLGEDVGVNGGVFRATAGLQERFGKERVQDTPLAEGMIAGMSVGMAAQGLKPVAEIQFMGFIYPALDQIVNHMAALRNRTRGRLTLPGGDAHAARRRHPRARASFREPRVDARHTPGLRVVCPSSPARAYGLLLAAIRDPDPVMFLEPMRLYRLVQQEVADDGQALPLDACFILREGDDVTLVTWGAMTDETLKAAEQLAEGGRQLRSDRPRHAIARSTTTPSSNRWRRPGGW